MRLWTLHPSYLDRIGLVALWREGLLAQKVLAGGTRGYRDHPQLVRFRRHSDPVRAIGSYLQVVVEEAVARGYRFDAARIVNPGECEPIECTEGQLAFERAHLLAKLRVRDPDRSERLERGGALVAHPLFVVRPGGVAEWERGSPGPPS